jgi:hypothetical protein
MPESSRGFPNLPGAFGCSARPKSETLSVSCGNWNGPISGCIWVSCTTEKWNPISKIFIIRIRTRIIIIIIIRRILIIAMSPAQSWSSPSLAPILPECPSKHRMGWRIDPTWCGNDSRRRRRRRRWKRRMGEPWGSQSSPKVIPKWSQYDPNVGVLRASSRRSLGQQADVSLVLPGENQQLQFAGIR